jgi:hypothetical protein
MPGRTCRAPVRGLQARAYCFLQPQPQVEVGSASSSSHVPRTLPRSAAAPRRCWFLHPRITAPNSKRKGETLGIRKQFRKDARADARAAHGAMASKLGQAVGSQSVRRYLHWHHCSKYHIVHNTLRNILRERTFGPCHDVVLCRLSKYHIVARPSSLFTPRDFKGRSPLPGQVPPASYGSDEAFMI